MTSTLKIKVINDICYFRALFNSQNMRKPLLYLILLFSTVINAQELTVEKIWKEYQFFGRGVDGFRSMQDGMHFTKRENRDNIDCIVKHPFKSPNDKGTLLVKLDELKLNGSQVKIDDYEFNKDETKILFTTETESIYRYSFFAKYLIYDLKTKELKELDTKRSPQMLAEYSPDGTKVSYLFENNLYVKDLKTNAVT